MKIRSYEMSIDNFLRALTGGHKGDADKLIMTLEHEDMLSTFDNEELIQEFIDMSLGSSSEVCLFPGDGTMYQEWVIINIESATALQKLLCAGVEEGSIKLPSGDTDLCAVRGLREVPYREIKAVMAKFPKISGFTEDVRETEYVIDHLSARDEYLASNDSTDIIRFIIGREDDNRGKFYISFDEDFTQVSVLPPADLAEEINELLEDYEIEKRER